MDLNIYEIIKGPVATAKAYQLNKDLKKLVLNVHPQANKPAVKKALEALFAVKVDSVRIIVRKGKNKRAQRHTFKGTLTKKAIVTLAEGYSLDLFERATVDSAQAA